MYRTRPLNTLCCRIDGILYVITVQNLTKLTMSLVGIKSRRAGVGHDVRRIKRGGSGPELVHRLKVLAVYCPDVSKCTTNSTSLRGASFRATPIK